MLDTEDYVKYRSCGHLLAKVVLFIIHYIAFVLYRIGIATRVFYISTCLVDEAGLAGLQHTYNDML